MAKKIIIIGAGIAGLSAGIYARKNGYAAVIYESHHLPGGMCTAWRRRGFTFEGCMHFLGFGGLSPRHNLHSIWMELGILPGMKTFQHEIVTTLRDTTGRSLNLYADLSRLEKELLSVSPSDAKESRSLCRAAKRVIWFIRTIGKNPFLYMARTAGILRGIPLLKKYANLTIGEYAARFNDPLIRRALANFLIFPDTACVQLFFFLAMLHLKSLGYPEGSSLSFARTIEKQFTGLAGIIEYNKKVKRIIAADGRATGIELEDGSIETADIVISAADGHTTLYDMLEDKFTTAAMRERFATRPVYPPFIQVSLGVNRDMGGAPHSESVEMPAPFEIAGTIHQALWYENYAFDATSAPQGKTAITVLYASDISWWEKIEYGSDNYKTEKKRILETTIAQLEKVLPGISSQIETADVATPYTTIRYTNNWKGALGFLLTNKITADLVMKPQYELPGLGNFYMTGQWVRGPSVVMAAISGKEVIRKICQAESRKFKSGAISPATGEQR